MSGTGVIEPRDKLTMVEIERLIRCARACRDEMIERKLQLQEKELQRGNGHTREAILACENDCFLLTSAVAKLWNLLHPAAK